jgi:hypothetical protein
MDGLCECGCGQKTPLATYTQRTRGYIKGQPVRYIQGHQPHPAWTEERRDAFRAKMLGHPVSSETRRKTSANHKANGVRPSAEALAKSIANRPKREESARWKGGTSMINGYRGLYQPEHPRAHPNGYVYEHIVVAEEMLGRPLTRTEVVHHRDGVTTNNDPANLRVFKSQSEHLMHHRAEAAALKS